MQDLVPNSYQISFMLKDAKRRVLYVEKHCTYDENKKQILLTEL